MGGGGGGGVASCREMELDVCGTRLSFYCPSSLPHPPAPSHTGSPNQVHVCVWLDFLPEPCNLSNRTQSARECVRVTVCVCVCSCQGCFG